MNCFKLTTACLLLCLGAGSAFGQFFLNPVIGSGADPTCAYKDGFYYYSQTTGGLLEIRKTTRLVGPQGLGAAPAVTVFSPPAPGNYDVWAPELKYINGNWYVYYAGDDGNDINHRMYVARANTQNPMGAWTFLGKICDTNDDYWAIDGNVIQKSDGSLYFVWSGHANNSPGNQYLYIAPMSNPWTISGPRVQIGGSAYYSWEYDGNAVVNEAPAILQHNGVISIVYSADGYESGNYCLGLLANGDGNLLNPGSWAKNSTPIFQGANGVISPGSCTFTTSLDGTENWMLFTAAQPQQDPSSGYREVHAQKFTWTPGYNTPSLGAPAPDGMPLAAPSGEFGSLVVSQGKPATFSCATLGTGPFSYQWRFNGVSIPGATSAVCSITSVQLTNVGGYSVIFSNSLGGAVSGPAFLSMSSPLTNASGSILAPPGMVNWWPADGNLQDIYGAQNATPINALAFTSGEAGLALDLNGTNSYARVLGATNLPPPWSLCLWVNRQDAPGASAALMGDVDTVLKLEQYNGAHQVGVTVSGVADYLFTPGFVTPANTWTHLAFVGTSNAVSLFANGVLAGSVAATNFPLARACIGADLLGDSPTDFMAGRLDEIQVFNRALAPAEINAIYQAGQAGLVRAPEFTGSAVLSGSGQVQFTLRGQTGKPVTVYTAPDFVNWILFGTFPNPTGATDFLDSSLGKSQRFYRALQW